MFSRIKWNSKQLNKILDCWIYSINLIFVYHIIFDRINMIVMAVTIDILPWEIMNKRFDNFGWLCLFSQLLDALCKIASRLLYMEIFSASLALCERNALISGGLFSKRASNVELWNFLCCQLKQAVEETVKLPVIWDVMTLMLWYITGGGLIIIVQLTHWGPDKIDAISQTTFSNAFSWMKMKEFRLGFH